MAEDERARHELFVRLEGVIGAEGAALLMERLPALPWTDLATKADLRDLEARMTATFRAELHEAIGAALTSQTRTIVLSMAALFLSNTGLAFAVMRAS